MAVPAADGIVLASAPSFDSVGIGILLFVFVSERHPIAVFAEHRVQILDAPQVIVQYRLSYRHLEYRRVRLATPVRATREKLLAALPAPLAAEAETLTDWFLHDPDRWDGRTPPNGELRRIADAIRRQRVIEVTLAAAATPFVVCPLGLVLKAGDWHLVHCADAIVDVLSLIELRAIRLTTRPFTAPVAFDLRAFWQQWLAGSR